MGSEAEGCESIGFFYLGEVKRAKGGLDLGARAP